MQSIPSMQVKWTQRASARTANFPITEAQKVELDRRLAKRASEKPNGVSLEQIAQKLGVAEGILKS